MVFPILMYDNLCTSCTKYAMFVDRISRGTINMIGLYSEEGKKFRDNLFPKEINVLEMSWFCDKGICYGGRKGLFKLLRYMIFKKSKVNLKKNVFSIKECTTNCSTVKGVMFRSFSIITKSYKVSLKKCDGCKTNVGVYKENQYTLLCGKCWNEIASNIVKNWESDKDKYHVWVYNADKLVIQ